MKTLSNFTDITPAHRYRPKRNNLPVFLTIESGYRVTVSRGGVRSMKGISTVRFLTYNHQLLLLESTPEDGYPFSTHGRETVMWRTNDVMNLVERLLPEGVPERFRVNGKTVEVEGKRGLLFNCEDIGRARDCRSCRATSTDR